MSFLWYLLACLMGLLAVGCAITAAVEIARGKMHFPANPSVWGALIFHLAVASMALWFLGLALGYS
jgi:hypothetical protein